MTAIHDTIARARDTASTVVSKTVELTRQYPLSSSLIGGGLLLIILIASLSSPASNFRVLTDPFLQLPRESSVNVVWFTEGKGEKHRVIYGPKLEKSIIARSTKMSRLRNGLAKDLPRRNIWRHEAVVKGLQVGKKTPYATISEDDGDKYQSKTFSLSPLPRPGAPVKILLTSDHQLGKMTPANMQKVIETIGKIDAIFFAGDLVSIPDNAEEWFDHPNGLGFFAVMQGRSQNYNKDLEYKGGALLQNTPLYTAIGNHEVMGVYNGRFSNFSQVKPRWFAEWLFDKQNEKKNKNKNKNKKKDHRKNWITNNSFNTTTYREIFSLPENELYYSQTFGNIQLITLYAARPWRTHKVRYRSASKYHEARKTVRYPEKWLFGEFFFEPISNGSSQYKWLQNTLSQKEDTARYRIVMTHQASRGLGGNTIPLMSDQIVTIVYKDKNGKEVSNHFTFPPDRNTWENTIVPILKTAKEVRYDYPKNLDHWKKSIEPLLESNDINLVFHGHSHLWYRLQTKRGLNYLETSNVGNSHGGFIRGHKARNLLPPDDPRFYDRGNYSSFGDPYEGQILTPTEFAPQKHQGRDLPFVSSNTHTVFTIIDTGKGIVSSYIFDTSKPDSKVRKFDEFPLEKPRS